MLAPCGGDGSFFYATRYLTTDQMLFPGVSSAGSSTLYTGQFTY